MGAQSKIDFVISQQNIVGTQKSRLNEKVLLSTEDLFKLLNKKIITILRMKSWLIWTYEEVGLQISTNLLICLLPSHLLFYDHLLCNTTSDWIASKILDILSEIV